MKTSVSFPSQIKHKLIEIENKGGGNRLWDLQSNTQSNNQNKQSIKQSIKQTNKQPNNQTNKQSIRGLEEPNALASELSELSDWGFSANKCEKTKCVVGFCVVFVFFFGKQKCVF